jgi:hypothetical protein
MIDPLAEQSGVKVEYWIQQVPLPIDDEDVTYHLNKLGADRWQLITVTLTNEARLWFMREVLPPPEPEEPPLEINPLEGDPNG